MIGKENKEIEYVLMFSNIRNEWSLVRGIDCDILLYFFYYYYKNLKN